MADIEPKKTCPWCNCDPSWGAEPYSWGEHRVFWCGCLTEDCPGLKASVDRSNVENAIRRWDDRAGESPTEEGIPDAVGKRVFQGSCVSSERIPMPKILYPEEKIVATWSFKPRYEDAVANGLIERPEGSLSWWEMAKALHEEGIITLAER